MSFSAAETVSWSSSGRPGVRPRFLAAAMPSRVRSEMSRRQANTRKRWLEARRKELLPVRYMHAVFTLPRELAALALQNKRVVYSLLFRSSAETLLKVARDPQRLGAEIGFFSVLHTWNQKLDHHPHVHCVLPAGGLSPDHHRWITPRCENFFLPKDVLAEVFRGKFSEALQQAFVEGRLCFHGHLKPLAQPRAFAAFRRTLFRKKWVVDLRPPFGGPGAALRTHSLLRLPRSPQACCLVAAVPPAHCSREAVSHDLRWRRRTRSHRLALPALRRSDAGRRTLQPRSAAAAFASAVPGSRLMQQRSPARSTRLLRREPLWCAYTTYRSLLPSLQPLWQHQNR